MMTDMERPHTNETKPGKVLTVARRSTLPLSLSNKILVYKRGHKADLDIRYSAVGSTANSNLESSSVSRRRRWERSRMLRGLYQTGQTGWSGGPGDTRRPINDPRVERVICGKAGGGPPEFGGDCALGRKRRQEDFEGFDLSNSSPISRNKYKTFFLLQKRVSQALVCGTE